MARRPKKGFESDYFKNDVVDVYLDPRNCEGYIGSVQLYSMTVPASPSRCFMLESEEKNNITRSLETWKGKMLYTSPLGKSHHYTDGGEYEFDLSMIYTKGRATSGVKSLRHAAGQISYSLDYEFIDNFEVVPGLGQQF